MTAWPFENADTTETQYSLLFRELQDSGVVGSFGDESLRATAPGTGMTVNIAAGRCIGRGFMGQSAGEAIAIAPASAGARVDRIVFRIDPTANTGTLVAIPGTSGSSAPPALEQTETGIWDVPLYRVAVAAGATTISASALTDERPWIGHRVGVWDDDRRPTGAARRIGRLGWNTARSAFEAWDGTNWVSVQPTNLNASVISSGTFAVARIPDLTVSKITGLQGFLDGKSAVGHTHNVITAGTMQWVVDNTNAYLLFGSTTPWIINSAGALIAGNVPASRLSGTIPAGLLTNAFVNDTLVGAGYRLLDVLNAKMDVNQAGSYTVGAANYAASAGSASNAGEARFAAGPTPNAFGRQAGSDRYATWMDGGYEFGRATSSRRYKDQIEPWNVDVDALLSVEPKMFHRLGEDEDKRDYGAIAEDLADAGLEPLIYRDDEGRVDAIREHRLAYALLAVAREQRDRIASLEARLARLEARP